MFRRRSYPVGSLLFFAVWIAGLILGPTAVLGMNFDFDTLLHTAVQHDPSFIGLAVILILPLAISALAARYRIYFLFYVLAFFKAFCFSFCVYSIHLGFGSAGWLVRWLLVFSDSCMLIPLFLLWYRNLSGKCFTFKKDITVCAVIAAVAGCIDICVISPFLTLLFCYS